MNAHDASAAPKQADRCSTPMRNGSSLRVLLVSGFFESSLVSFREYSYSKQLSRLGHRVTLMCGNQSYIWRRSPLGRTVTDPTEFDEQFVRTTGVRLLRRQVLLRMSDFVLYLPNLLAIRDADVVHIIEFRHGITVLVALIARAMRKPVIYDHEQRGDRTAHWYSRIDSLFRRALIFAGSLAVDTVRHTVLANRDHFRSCTFRALEMTFAPLGVDENQFYFDETERRALRAELGLSLETRVAVMSGKLHSPKKVGDVVRACRRAGVRLILVGTVAPDVLQDIVSLGPGAAILLPQASPDRLRCIYNAADYAIFTTFTVSYWEAHATGLRLLVPRSAFSDLVFARDADVTRFGTRDMFDVPDESYRDGINISNAIEDALRPERVLALRKSRTTFSAEQMAHQLVEQYWRTLNTRRLKRAKSPCSSGEENSDGFNPPEEHRESMWTRRNDVRWTG